MRFINYYRGTFYGKNSASITYELSVQLNKESRDMLWWRIVGLTDQILHQKCEEEEEQVELDACNREVLRLVPSNNSI